MTPLLKLLLERIDRSGPMPFAAYMQLALYHPRLGYYTAGPARTGWRGHFLTSPELDPAFGELWARGLEILWSSAGRPPRFDVVEVGPGEGGFARALLASATAGFGGALHMTLVERSAALQARQRDLLAGAAGRVSWSPSVAETAPVATGFVFANEVLDNLPVHVVEMRDGELLEVCIDRDGDGLAEVLLPPPSDEVAAYLVRCGVTVAPGRRMEVGLAAESFVGRAGALFERGGLVLTDYGATAADLAGRDSGTLLAYSAGGVDADVLTDPGGRDITSHTNWTAIAAACRAAGLDVAGPASQRPVLSALGLSDLDRTLKLEHDDAIEAGDGAGAVRAVSRRGALGALADPGGLGGLGVLVGVRGIPIPPFMAV